MTVPDFIGDEKAVTQTLGECKPSCPPLRAWSQKNLIMNACPDCYAPGDPGLTVREMAKRRALEERSGDGC